MSPQQQQQPAEKPATTPEQTEFQQLLKRPVKFGPKGVDLENLDDVWKFANTVLASEIAPKGMNTNQAVMIAVMMGAELGLKPMMAIQNIAVINGRPSIWGDAMLALCRQSGLFDEAVFLETCDGQEAVCTVRRKPDGKVIIRKFTMEMAKRAGLLDKNTPWRTYPERMLMFRARSWACRDTFGDVLSGLRGAEEERDIPADEPAEPPVSSLDELTAKLKEPGPPESYRPTGPSLAADEYERTHPEPKPDEEPIADPPTSPPHPYDPSAPPFNPPTEGEVKAAENYDCPWCDFYTSQETVMEDHIKVCTKRPTDPEPISNAERRSEEDRLFREFSQALADAGTASEVADLITKLEEVNNAGLLAGLDYLALSQEAEACKLRLTP